MATTPPSWHGPTADQDNPTVQESLQMAHKLRVEKLELRARTNANRDLLRLLREQGSASQAQADLIERYYPRKQTEALRKREAQNGGELPEAPLPPTAGSLEPPA